MIDGLTDLAKSSTYTPTKISNSYISALTYIVLTDYCRTTPISLKRGQIIEFTGKARYANDFVICLCDDDGTLRSNLISAIDDQIREFTFVAEMDCYVVLASLSSAFSTYTISEGVLIDSDITKAMFSTVLCIGDSITLGARDYAVGHNEPSYPTFLTRITGWAVTNAGINGISTVGWWSGYRNNYAYADFNAVIIKLGENMGLTDTLVEDTSSGDYLTYADTQTGRYCSIIENILTVNPLCKIFLATTRTLADNAVIYKIAAKYSLPYLDVHAQYLWGDINGHHYHRTSDWSSGGTAHFNTLGYFRLAKVIVDCMTSAIANDVSYKDYVNS